jgi:hypothetical protein
MTADAQQQAWDRQDRESRVARLTAKQLEVDDLAERIVALNRELSQARRKHQEARWELATLVRLLTATGPCRPAARPGQPPVPREETPAGRSLDPDPGDGQSPSAVTRIGVWCRPTNRPLSPMPMATWTASR